MRDNQPVTLQEHQVPEGATLMSTTDLDSRIIYANGVFTEVSGFTQEELVGQPHNLVRHPDMPRAAFADMWATLKRGQSWSALVKNRRKDGAFYWVRANATMVRRGGRPWGYMSVRTPVGAEEVAQAERLYQRLRGGLMRGWTFRQGLLVRSDWLRPLSAWRLMSLQTRLLLAGVLAAALALLPVQLAGATPLAAAAGLALGVAAQTAYLRRQVLYPVRHIAAQAARVASGESIAVSELGRLDELGLLMRSVNQSGLNLRSLVADVAGQMERLAQASDEVKAGSADVSARSRSAAEQLSRAGDAVGSLGRSSEANARSAEQVRALAEQAAAVAQSGGEAMRDAVQRMQELGQASQRIADIVSTIDGLAFQTNVLALNASIEAARAGLAGRGFAVVAQEVRALSQSSAQAAREIRALVEDSLRHIGESTEGVAAADRTGELILARVKEVSRLVGEIASESAQQAVGVQEVHTDLDRLQDLTRQNMAMVAQSAAAAAELNQRAQQLIRAVAVYREA
ncbi:MAG: methyl-accepting chemotaxis protein [Comamonadaceae bacterium]|nr:methyl-accepting chemotaxis protein [Comamonadaceae bacterium]